MKYLKKTIPEGWKPNDTERMNKWFDNLPIVKDLEEIEEIERRYETLKLKE